MYSSVCPVPPCTSKRSVSECTRGHGNEPGQPASLPPPPFPDMTTHLTHLPQGLDVVERLGEPDVDRLRPRPIAGACPGLGLGAGHRGFLDGRAASAAHAGRVYPPTQRCSISRRTLAGGWELHLSGAHSLLRAVATPLQLLGQRSATPFALRGPTAGLYHCQCMIRPALRLDWISVIPPIRLPATPPRGADRRQVGLPQVWRLLPVACQPASRPASRAEVQNRRRYPSHWDSCYVAR